MQIKERLEATTKLDSEILALVSGTEENQEAVDDEIEGAGKFREKVLEAIMELKEELLPQCLGLLCLNTMCKQQHYRGLELEVCSIAICILW